MRYPGKVWLLLVGVVMAAGGCSRAVDPWEGKPEPHILASFPPLYSFAANVAGQNGSVLCLMTTTGPHDYQPNTTDALKLRKANVFLINGLGLDEEFATRLKKAADNPRLQVLEAGECVNDKKKTGAIQHEGHSHPAGFDPHVWLGPTEAIAMVKCIRDELKKRDPPHAADYDYNADAYIGKLNKLLADGRAQLKDRKNRKLVSFHESLFYFARAFDLEIVDSIEMQPGEEPSASKIAKLVALCKKEGVRVIAVEPQYPSNTSAHTLLTELKKQGIPDAEFVVVDPLETVPSPADLTPDFYERKMRENLDNLAKALR